MYRSLRDHIQSWVSCGIQYLVMFHVQVIYALGDFCQELPWMRFFLESIAEIRHISQVPRTLIYLAFVAAFVLYQ